MAGDDFALVVVGETDWAWDLDAVAAAIASAWTQADIREGYPLAGSTFRVFAYIPDPRAGRNMEVALDDSGRMISLEYGSPEGSAEFVTWVLNRFPPPDDVTVQLFEWGHHPRVTPDTTVQDLLSIGPGQSVHHPIPAEVVGLLPRCDGQCCDRDHPDPAISHPQRPLTSTDGIR